MYGLSDVPYVVTNAILCFSSPTTKSLLRVTAVKVRSWTVRTRIVCTKCCGRHSSSVETATVCSSTASSGRRRFAKEASLCRLQTHTSPRQPPWCNEQHTKNTQQTFKVILDIKTSNFKTEALN